MHRRTIQKLGDNVNTADPKANYLCGFAYFDRGCKKTIICCVGGFFLIDTVDITQTYLDHLQLNVTGPLL